MTEARWALVRSSEVSNLLQLPLLSLPPSILRGSHLEPC